MTGHAALQISSFNGWTLSDDKEHVLLFCKDGDGVDRTLALPSSLTGTSIEMLAHAQTELSRGKEAQPVFPATGWRVATSAAGIIFEFILQSGAKFGFATTRQHASGISESLANILGPQSTTVPPTRLS